jgi:hypothetical protein
MGALATSAHYDPPELALVTSKQASAPWVQASVPLIPGRKTEVK